MQRACSQDQHPCAAQWTCHHANAARRGSCKSWQQHLNCLLAASVVDVQDFDSHSLARLAFGLASVGYDDADLYSAITKTAADDLENMTPADVSQILWACGETQHLCDKFMSGG